VTSRPAVATPNTAHADATAGGADVVALVIVDVQHDYLSRPGLVPGANQVVGSVATVLEAFRGAGAPVAHVHTVVPPDGTGALPHWRTGNLMCVDGTPGVLPPVELAPAPGEFVAHKRHYSGFADPGLEPWLAAQGVTTVAVAGLMEHGCVRSTALDAAAAGFAVVVVSDATATDDPDHATATRHWLDTRVAPATTTTDLVGRLTDRSSSGTPDTPARRAAAAAASAGNAQRLWALVAPHDRAATIERWAAAIEARTSELAGAITADVHKPITQATDEVRRTVAHLRSAAQLATIELTSIVGDGVRVRRRPVGVVALVMPWNNPLALPVAKAAAALAVGNAVVLKPAPQAPTVTALLLATAASAGVPDGVIEVVHGGPDAAMAVVGANGIDAAAVTGSIPTGRRLAAECLRLARPMQAELGGNNAVVVLADADLATEVPVLVAGAFAFGGQRCTAIRRAVVERAVLDRFITAAIDAMNATVVGDPLDHRTHVGPLVSPEAAQRVHAAITEAVTSGARLVHQVALTPPDDRGWCAPTLLMADDPTLSIVTSETFGPVLVIQPADDVAHAIALANGVDQGLVGAVSTTNTAMRHYVADRLDVGIVHIGAAPAAIDPDAPFGGWGTSGIGPPEHGVWDLDLFTRTQAVYRL